MRYGGVISFGMTTKRFVEERILFVLFSGINTHKEFKTTKNIEQLYEYVHDSSTNCVFACHNEAVENHECADRTVIINDRVAKKDPYIVHESVQGIGTFDETTFLRSKLEIKDAKSRYSPIKSTTGHIFHDLRRARYDEWTKTYHSNVPHFVNCCADLSGAESMKPMEPMFVNDCENMKKPLLVLDMDETLIHTANDDEQPSRAPDFTFSLDTCESSFDVYERPGVHEFLKQVASDFEVAVWTAGTRDYAEPILDWLDRDGVITTRLYRDSCTLHHYGFYVKDLGKLNTCLSKIIIVDNNPRSFAFHQRNGIKCSDYYFDEYDEELKRIHQFLHYVKNFTDFRDFVPKYHIWAEQCHLNTHKFVQPCPPLPNLERHQDPVQGHNEPYSSHTSVVFSQNETDQGEDIVMCDVDSFHATCISISMNETNTDGDTVMCDVDYSNASYITDPDGDTVMCDVDTSAATCITDPDGDTFMCDVDYSNARYITDPDGDTVMCDVDSSNASYMTDPDGDTVMCDIDYSNAIYITDPDGDTVMCDVDYSNAIYITDPDGDIVMCDRDTSHASYITDPDGDIVMCDVDMSNV